MHEKQQLFTDKDLDKQRKNNRFHRDEEMSRIIHSIHCWSVRFTPFVLVGLFVIDLVQPSWIKNLELLDRVVYLLGGGLLGTLLVKVKQREV